MTIAEAFAPAKINLSLHVTGQRPDGYHLLDSLVVFADVGDRLWLQPGPRMSVAVSGPFASGVPVDARNLVWQAAALAGWTGQIRLEKNLPHGAGIGSGSSDAAAVLQALGAAVDGAALGADVPVCMVGRATRMSGIGEVLQPAPELPPLYAVLVNPGVALSTPQVFAALGRKENAAMTDMPPHGFKPWIAEQRNDLEAPARALRPVISDALTELGRLDGAGVVRMSGSGTTCFALFDQLAFAESGARDLARSRPGWWVQSTRLS